MMYVDEKEHDVEYFFKKESCFFWYYLMDILCSKLAESSLLYVYKNLILLS